MAEDSYAFYLALQLTNQGYDHQNIDTDKRYKRGRPALHFPGKGVAGKGTSGADGLPGEFLFLGGVTRH